MYHYSPDTGMGPFMVVIFKVLQHDIAKLLLSLQDEMIQAFGLYGLDEGLNVAIEFR